MSAIALYKIAADIEQALAATDDDGGIPADLEQRIECLQMAFDDKAAAVVAYTRNLSVTKDALDAEIARLKAWAKALDDKETWLRDYLKRCMEQAGYKSIETPVAKVRIQKNSRPSISVAEGQPIPPMFTKVVTSFDGQAAYEAWKAGQPLPDSITVTQGNHLRIT